jgi:hypothetical protein
MKYDQATIDIRPRGTFEILDLALLFYRAHLGLFFKTSLVFGTPIIMFAFAVHSFTNLFWVGLLAYWFLLPLNSGAVIIAASRLVFGIDLDVKRTLLLYRPLAASHFRVQTIHRLAWLVTLPFLLGEMLRLNWAFTPMVLLLERLSGPTLTTRVKSLHKRSGSHALLVDLASLTFAGASILALGFVFDLVFSDIVALWDFGGLFTEVGNHPFKITLWLVAATLVVPVLDLCWFFYYLDARIRKEGWDLELGLRDAATRLGSRHRDTT